ncbi:MAG: phosphoribosylformylglycinamidine cyclo-ligase [Acidobacteria bacterium]|nr:phosphoribosylformylglycinamidine cyclo-ligase [Acidobacteriota bacterium]|tara:strand:+ start:1852 stop:2883 length:1032 start_codon:yes stop_codon:yes gene_type:complete
MDYKSVGVDIDAGNELVSRIRGMAQRTFTSGVLSDIGSFGGLFRPDLSETTDPVLVSSADGVGTKLKVAFLAGRHATVGVDLVNHCVNDILVQGAKPLFFMDYLATGRLSPAVTAEVVGGIASGCVDNGCALLGGETAEMPGFYADGEYDLAGFVVGLVDRQSVIDGRRIEPGDQLIGLPSNGLHTNGYSLARHIVFDSLGLGVDDAIKELGGSPADLLLTPHRSYLRSIGSALSGTSCVVKGLAHITGGGLTDNLPRVLPTGTAAEIDRSTWVPLPIFRFLQDRGALTDDEVFRTFNMGIGMVAVCSPEHTRGLLSCLEDAGEDGALVIGRVIPGGGIVSYI